MYKEFILKARGCECPHGKGSVRFAFTTANSKWCKQKKNIKTFTKQIFHEKESLNCSGT